VTLRDGQRVEGPEIPTSSLADADA